MKPVILFAVVLIPALGLSACARGPEPATSSQAVATPKPQTGTAARGDVPAVATRVDALPLAVVHKSPTCGCCDLWVDHLRHAGFQVEVRNQDNLNPLKERLGVPYGKGSCHTAEIGDYVIEGHVPAADIKRLLSEKPDAKGLVHAAGLARHGSAGRNRAALHRGAGAA